MSISCEPWAVLVPLLLGPFFVWEKTNPYLLEASVLFVCSWLGNAILQGSQWQSLLLTEAVVVFCSFSHWFVWDFWVCLVTCSTFSSHSATNTNLVYPICFFPPQCFLRLAVSKRLNNNPPVIIPPPWGHQAAFPSWWMVVCSKSCYLARQVWRWKITDKIKEQH